MIWEDDKLDLEQDSREKRCDVFAQSTYGNNGESDRVLAGRQVLTEL